jgi:catechol 2,3-dioxygenase-like lactoylglutathione lyase family enzyme
MFGGERGKLRNQFDGIRYGGVWLLAQASGGSTESASKGYAIDHLGWRPENVDGEIAELKTRGATIVSEPRANGDLRYAFVEAPAGVQIELTQRPSAEKVSR